MSIQLFAFAPEAGIAESGDGEARRRRGDDGIGKFLPGAQIVVLGDGEALRFAPGVDAIAQSRFGVSGGRCDGGVDHGRLAVDRGRRCR